MNIINNIIKSDSCAHFGQCSGCQIDLTASTPPIWLDVLPFFEERGLSHISYYDASSQGWRVRAKLAVRGESSNPVIGLFREGTHEVLPIPFCRVHHPHINRAVEVVRQWIKTNDLEPYNELTKQGELRYLQFVVERSTGLVQASFILNFADLSHSRAQEWVALLKQLGEQNQDRLWHSLWINLNNRPTNTIFGNGWHLCYGSDILWENVGHISIAYQPSSFAQSNLDLFEQLLMRLKDRIPLNSKLVEFYAGVGVMGLFVVDRCQWVRCAEINPQAEMSFLKSRERLNDEEAEKISFHSGSAHHLINLLKDAEVAIVDPPRKGLDSDLIQAIVHSPTLKHLFYLSCGWHSFKRDCDLLLQAGWKLKLGEGYFFFPGTNHIEILAQFVR